MPRMAALPPPIRDAAEELKEEVEEGMPEAARTEMVVASSTRRRILTMSKNTAGSIGCGRGVAQLW